MKVHIGTEISRIQKIRGLSNEEFAEAIHTTYRNVSKIKSKEEISVSLLWQVSEALNYDFFKLYNPVVIEPKEEFAPGAKKPAKEEKKLTVKFEVQYPVSEASELGKFMMYVDQVATKMGFEVL